MPSRSLRQILGANVRSVRESRRLSQPDVTAEAKRLGYKIDQTTIGRVERASTPVTIDKLEAVAKGLRVEAWQLLVPDLKPDALPVAAAAPVEVTEADLQAVEQLKHELADLTPTQRDLFINSAELQAMMEREPYPVEKMDRKWSAASKTPSRRSR